MSLIDSTTCCDETIMGNPSPDEGTVIKCKCGRYWKRQSGWNQLGIFEIMRLRKMGRIE